MRPKKAILLVDGNQDRHTQRRFILETRGYRVLSAGAVLAVGHLLAEWSPELVVVSNTVPLAEQALRLAANHFPEVRAMLLVDRTGRDFDRANVHVACVWESRDTAEVLARIRLLVARKRGPRKRPVAASIPSREEAA